MLSLVSWIAALRERRALQHTGQNGAMRAAVRLHLITSSCRMLAATLSVGGGAALIVLPDFVLPSGVLAGLAWLMYNMLMGVSLVTERWANCTMAVALASKEALTLVDEMVMQRIERTAERLERQHERENKR